MPATLTGRVAFYAILVINHLAPLNTACSNCPFQWKEFSGHCYWMVTEKMSFQAAENHCQDRSSKLGMQSHLMSVTSPEESAFLRNYTADVLGEGHQALWIGLNDRAQPGIFVWTDGSSTPYCDFNPGEPNGSNSEDCVVLWNVDHWNDIDCARNFEFVCKMPGRFHN
ncbi:alpha-N-acetylgalactosamine-specific lectin-like [Patiria miniata]|uniref:C-type lectin domain-containing protein n=1 Tax=Patiria miniata TaxID=46514 RepID=A0A914APV5_PATMI|nr:alpha-N-acetylgalactosamine-specific lectin-like [Patiria miniata]